MPVKSKTKTIEFGKQDEGFIKQLAKDIGCYYSKMNERTYTLNKFDSDIRNEMGIFAWVHKEETDCFWISTRKVWVEEAKAKVLASRKASGINCFTRDTKPAGDSVIFDVKDDYPKSVIVLKLVSKMR